MGRARTREQREDDRLMSEFWYCAVPAAEELFLRFAPRIFGIGIQAFHDADLASELVQNTFIKLWRRAPHFSSRRSPLDTWVLAQALGAALQMSRTRGASRDSGEPMGSTRSRRTDAEPVPA